MLQKIRTVFVAIELILSIAITIVVMFIFRRCQKPIRRFWANSQKYLIGFRIKTVGKPNPEAKLIIINHQSMLDIIALEAVYPADLAWVAKKEVFDTFFFGQSVKISKMIKIDRGDKRAMVRLIKEAEERLGHNRPIAIFPEGTRGRGDKLIKFQMGAKVLAEKLELSVQPVVIANAKEILDSQNFKSSGGEIIVSYLPIINPKDDKNWYENLQEAMQRELTTLLENKQIR